MPLRSYTQLASSILGHFRLATLCRILPCPILLSGLSLGLFIPFTPLAAEVEPSSTEAPINHEAPISSGLQALLNFDFSGAYSELREHHENLSPSDPLWPEAAYAYAQAAWHRSPPNNNTIRRAREVLEEVAIQAEGTPLGAAALLDIGRILEVADNRDDQPDPEQAERYYRRVLEEYAGSRMAQRAALYLAQVKVQSLEEARVREALNILQQTEDVDRFPEWAAVMTYYAAHLSYFYLDDADTALAYFERARQLGFANQATADRKLWQFAQIARKTGRSNWADKWLQQLLNEYPNSIYGWAARQQLGASPDSETLTSAQDRP